MKNILQYKGYFTKIEFSVEDQLLYGKIEGIKDLVNFESKYADQIEQEFQNAVDDYLDLCEELGQTPDKAYSGTFNVRINPALHRSLAMHAIKTDESLNSTVEKAIDAFINNTLTQKVDAIWSSINEKNYTVSGKSLASTPQYTPLNGWSNYKKEETYA